MIPSQPSYIAWSFVEFLDEIAVGAGGFGEERSAKAPMSIPHPSIVFLGSFYFVLVIHS